MLVRSTIALLVAGVCGAADAAVYRVVDLGTLGGDTSFAQAINDAGQIVGTSNGPLVNDVRQFSNHAFLWQGGVIRDLGHLGQNESFGLGLNAAGTLVGHSTTLDTTGSGTVQHGFLWRNGVISDIGLPANGQQARPLAVRADGKMVGYATGKFQTGDTTNAYFRGFVYTPGAATPFQMVGTLEDKGSSVLRAVNDAGIAVGVASIVKQNESIQHAFKIDIRTPTQLVDLGSLGGVTSEANDINAGGKIVGTSRIAGNARSEAFLYDDAASPKMKSLGLLAEGSLHSEANAINDAGVIVGFGQVSVNGALRQNAFVIRNGKMENLNALIACNSGWELTEAKDINNAGQIVGYGLKGDKTRAFLLEPITNGTADDCTGGVKPPQRESGGGSAPALAWLALLGAALWRRTRA